MGISDEEIHGLNKNVDANRHGWPTANMHPPPPYYLLPSDEELVNGYVDEELGSPTSPLASSVSRPWPTHIPYGWSKRRLNHRFQRVCLRKSFILFLSGAGVAIIVLSILYLGLVSSAFIPVSVFFGVSTLGDASNLPPPMLSHSLLRGDCLEAWVAHGKVCNHLDLSSVEVLDAVWSWVNGSDPRHQASRSFWDDKPVEYSIAVTQQPSSSVRQVPSSQAALDEAPKSALRKDKRTESRSPPSKRLSRQSMPNAQINEKWFRDHDELRYSMRSVYQHLAPYLRTAHILATDFSHPFVAPAVLARSRPPASNRFIDTEGHVNSSLVGVSDIFGNPDSATNGSWREGQWPQWLDADSEWMRKESDSGWKGGVRVHHHWNLFSVPPGLRRQESGKDDLSTNESSVVDELHWKERILPTFNSFAIESQIANIPDLSENFIYNNDDFFLGMDLSLSDFVTPLFGTVFRMLGDLRVEPLENSRADPSGEWRALHRSNWVLSQRFGSRKRPYIIHATKTLSTPLLQETRMMFPEAFALTATHRFRAKGHDINAVFLTNHMTVERHREALLWSFVVARGDKDADGILDEAEITDLMSIVEHGTTNAQKPKVVTLPFRKTLHDGRPDSILQSVGLPRPEQTGYLFSSRDGYPYIGGLTGFTKHSVSSYPDMSRTDAPKLCSLNLNQCFAIEGNTTRADTFFKRVAFEQPNCGDCLIYHLINLSGDLGLSSFLPPVESQFPVNASTVNSGVEPTPFLPLSTEWGSSNFSLSNVAFETGWPGQSRREFAMRLIQRYSYIMGSSPIEFAALKSPKQAAETIGNLNRTENAFICVNDDITSGQEQISKTFSSWLHYAFPDALPYELTD